MAPEYSGGRPPRLCHSSPDNYAFPEQTMPSVSQLICAALLGLASVHAAATEWDARITAAAQAVEEQVITWRRDIHEHPELSNREFRTSKLVAAHLRSLGLEVQTGVAHTGVVGVLRGGRSGPVVALRADMDGLPVEERTGLPFASRQRATYNGQDVGVMHACGHDTHVAILMGTASVLTGMREDLRGTVKFIFQPAEEGAPAGEEGGAGLMVKEGVLANPEVDAIFGLHVSQQNPVGQASYRARGTMASAQSFEIHIQGQQTHGARPWGGADPVAAGAQMVTALQTIVSRQVDLTLAPAVVSVSTFHAGIRHNIIPDEAHLTGTIRTFDEGMRVEIAERIEAIAQATASTLGATATVTIDPGVPVTWNDENLTAQMVPSLERVYGAENLNVATLTTGAEDFSFYQQAVPGLFFFIGGRPLDVAAEDAIPNHSPLFTADEGALLPAVRAMTTLAVDYLEYQ